MTPRNAPFLCLNRKGLETILPHRGAALRKIDGVFFSEQQPNRMLGVKAIDADDRDLEGHFPGVPTYPGYAQDEFVCLVAAALIPATGQDLEKNPHVVQKVVRYKNAAGAGDTLIAEVKLVRKRANFYIFSGEIRNQENTVVAEYEKIVGAA